MTARYDAVAEFYDAFAPEEYTSPQTAALLDVVGEVRGLRVLDVACGHGVLSRELARRGATVVGVDLSVALVEKARSREEADPLGAVYLVGDVASPELLAGESFNAVTCQFGLSDIDDLGSALATVRRVLVPGGWFAFSILHPCFAGWPSREARPSWDPARGYFWEGWWRADGPAHGLRPRVGANHRMLSSYVNALVSSGLGVEEVREPEPAREWLSAPPDSGAGPVFLVCRCR